MINNKKGNIMLKLLYILATVFIIGFVGIVGGLMDIFQVDKVVDTAAKLGYPLYFFPLLGIFKLLGAFTILIPKKVKTLKDIAYSGFAMDFIFASYSHYNVQSPILEVAIPVILLIILIFSYLMGKQYSLYSKGIESKFKHVHT